MTRIRNEKWRETRDHPALLSSFAPHVIEAILEVEDHAAIAVGLDPIIDDTECFRAAFILRETKPELSAARGNPHSRVTDYCRGSASLLRMRGAAANGALAVPMKKRMAFTAPVDGDRCVVSRRIDSVNVVCHAVLLV
jgi:hypothetical protein